MARPKKNEPDKLTHRLPEVRCSGGDLAMLKAKASRCGVSRGEYLRRQIRDGKIVVVEARTDFALTHQVNMIGVNLRQALQEFRYDGGRDPERLLQAIDTAAAILDIAHEDMRDGSARR